MSTKIGILVEGVIDLALLPPLLTRIAQEHAGYKWPVSATDLSLQLQIPSRGHGSVLVAVRTLFREFQKVEVAHRYDYAGFVILLDRKTRPVQEEIRKLIGTDSRFVLGIAIEEIEAWWLADRKNTIAWAGLEEPLPRDLRYAARDYNAEKDENPKQTLSELTAVAERFDRVYGDGDEDMAREFAAFWETHVPLEVLRAQCSQGFGAFERDAANLFRRMKTARSAPKTSRRSRGKKA
jgi:hypothetical protein